ncbi:MAG TPA: hypothetical protein VIQ30_23275 [Pseudonocardia sp.]
MTPISEQRIPWLRGERRSAGGAGAVAARDQPQHPRRPLPSQLPRSRVALLVVVALGLLVGVVAMCLGPLADRCGPVGDVKRCGGGPGVATTPADKPWTPAFESVVPAPGAVVLPVDVPAPVIVPAPVVGPAAPGSEKPTAASARKPSPARTRTSVPLWRTAQESRTGGRDSSEDESEESSSDSEDE